MKCFSCVLTFLIHSFFPLLTGGALDLRRGVCGREPVHRRRSVRTRTGAGDETAAADAHDRDYRVYEQPSQGVCCVVM